MLNAPEVELNEESSASNRILKIDWSDVSAMPDEVLSLRRMSWYLEDWDGKDLARILEVLTIFTDVPLACKGTNCRFAKTCALCKHKTVDRWAKTGAACPLEVVESFKHFANYINTLHILPSDYTSIQIVNDLVRLLIQTRRCDLMMREEDPVETMVMGIAPRGSAPPGASSNPLVAGRKPNELLVVQERLRRDINTAYKNLLASREAQLKERQMSKNNTDVSSAMSDLVASMNTSDKDGK